jgi:hypothetical protein
MIDKKCGLTLKKSQNNIFFLILRLKYIRLTWASQLKLCH